MARTRTAAAAALAVAMLASGCFEVASEVPAITLSSRAASLPMASGRYCGVDVDLDETGAMEPLTADSDCFEVTVEGGALKVRPDDPAEPDVLTLEVADLGRGLRLMQGHDIDDEGYQLLVIAMSEDGLAILEDTSRTPDMDAAAAAAGVTLSESSDLQIVAGEPDAVLGLMREATGLRLDAALRDDARRREVIGDAIYYVRVAPDALDADADKAATLAAVEGLAEIFERAMALE